jgi:hypothetical protein
MTHICPIFNEFERSDFIAVTEFGEVKVARFFVADCEWEFECPVVIIGPNSRAKRYEGGTIELIQKFTEQGIDVKLNSHAADFVKYVQDEHRDYLDYQASKFDWK